MRMLRKQVLKEDGRYLVYYHNPETATPEQAAAFASVEAPAEEVSESKNHGEHGGHGEKPSNHGEHGETRRDSETPENPTPYSLPPTPCSSEVSRV